MKKIITIVLLFTMLNGGNYRKCEYAIEHMAEHMAKTNVLKENGMDYSSELHITKLYAVDAVVDCDIKGDLYAQKAVKTAKKILGFK